MTKVTVVVVEDSGDGDDSTVIFKRRPYRDGVCGVHDNPGDVLRFCLMKEVVSERRSRWF